MLENIITDIERYTHLEVPKVFASLRGELWDVWYDYFDKNDCRI